MEWNLTRPCRRLAALLLICAGFTVPAAAQDLVHSDVPLFVTEQDGIWPPHVNTEDSFGCAHNMKLGDWQFDVPRGENLDWMRLSNYGAVHSFIVENRGYACENLGKQGYRFSVMVALGQAESWSGRVDLWALQSGARPGSDYLLLARKPDSDPGLIAAFDVLQMECPKRNVRETRPIDLLLSRYCATNTREDLVAFARSMAKRRPLSRITFVGASPED